MADDSEVIDWPPETIPASDKLYMRIHRSFVRNGDFLPGAFQDRGGGMSTEWERYATPLETRQRARSPANNGVIQMIAGDVTTIPGLTVKHTPDVERRVRAHTDVLGDKYGPEIRVKLKRISAWVPGLTLV